MSKRVDHNHKSIVEGLRAVGASVVSLAALGKGAPDIAVGHRGRNYLFEIKNANMPPSKRRLTLAEESFHESWRGQVSIVASLEDALQAIGATSQEI